MERIIPKKIHYFWFGYNRKPAIIKKCIKSWRKYLPDYEIIEWNESNFDVNQCDYTKEAYSAKKWAYVSDYARFKVLYEYGGIYLDTDVEILRSIDELLTSKFMGFAREDLVATGLIMASMQNDWFCGEILKTYENEHFVLEKDPLKMYSIGKRTAKILEKHGLVYNGKVQKVVDYTIYPDYYFNSTNGDIFSKPDPRAYTIHHYAATWFSPKDRLKNTIKKIIGKKRIQKVKALIKRKS